MDGRLVHTSNSTVAAGVVLYYYVFENIGRAKVEISRSDNLEIRSQIVECLVVSSKVTRILDISKFVENLIDNKTGNEKVERSILTERVGVGVKVVVDEAQVEIEIVLLGDIRWNEGELSASSSHI